MRFVLAHQPRYLVLGMAERRNAAKLTFRALARSMAVSIGYLNDIDKGHRTVSATQRRQLEQLLQPRGGQVHA